MEHENEIQLSRNVEIILRRVLVENNFRKDVQYIITAAGSAKRDNYVGEICRVVVEEDNNKLSLILKLAPAHSLKKQKLQSGKLFTKESNFYQKIYPTLKGFKNEKEDNNNFEAVAKCYHACKDVIILEDLNDSGYKMADRISGLSFHHLEVVLTALARFHALSFALKHQKPLIYKSVARFAQEVVLGDIVPEDTFNQISAPVADAALRAVSGEKYHQRLLTFTNSFYQNMYDMTRDKHDGYVCINHGDCWVNNLLFSYTEDGPPVSAKLLDFQVCRESSPLLDIGYLVYCSALKDVDVRSQHWTELMDGYYRTLETRLRDLGSDPSKVYPRDIFEKHITKYMKFALGQAIMIIPIITAEAEQKPGSNLEFDMSQKGLLGRHAQDIADLAKTEACQERFRDVISAMADRGFI